MPIGTDGPSSLAAGDVVGEIPCGSIPVINRLVAGYRGSFTDLDYPPRVADEYAPCPETGDSSAFAACILGDSMAPTYADGDLVVFTPSVAPQIGQACFVRFAETHETTFKLFFIDSDGLVRLQPINAAYQPQRVPRESIAALYPAAYRITRL